MELSALTITPELVHCAIASLQWKWRANTLGVAYILRPSPGAERLTDDAFRHTLVEQVVRIFQGDAYVPEVAQTEHFAVLISHKVRSMVRLSLLDSLVHETAYLATYPAIREYIREVSPHSHGHTLKFPSAQGCGLVEPYTQFEPQLLWALESTVTAETSQPSTPPIPYGYACDIRQCSESLLISRLIHQLRTLGIPDTIVHPLETLWRAHSVTGETGLPYNLDAATWGWLNLYFLPIDQHFAEVGLNAKRSYDSYYFALEHPRELQPLLKTIVPVLAAANFRINTDQSYLYPTGKGWPFYFKKSVLMLDLLLSGRKAWVVGSTLYCWGYRPRWLENQLIHIIKLDCPRRLNWLCDNVTPSRWTSIERLCQRFFDATAPEESSLSFMLWQTLQFSSAAPYSSQLVAQWVHLNR